MLKSYMRKYLQWVEKNKKIKGNYYISYEGAYGMKEMMNKEWFNSTIKMPFEDTFIEVPSGYNNILNKLYGNYKLLPPKEKQYSIHGRYFINLSHRFTIEEIRKIQNQ